MDTSLLELWHDEGEGSRQSSLSSLPPSQLQLSSIDENDDPEQGQSDPLAPPMGRSMSQLLPELELEEPQLSSRSLAGRKWIAKQLQRIWESPTCGKGSSAKQLCLSALVVVTGVAHVVFFKLQTVPMYNYPTFLSVYSSCIYLLVYFCCLAYASTKGWFTPSSTVPPRPEQDQDEDHQQPQPQQQQQQPQTRANWRAIAIISFLSALGSLLQVVAVSHVPGTLIILLLQSATPILVALHFWSQQGEGIASYSQFGALTIIATVIMLLMFSGTTTRQQTHSWWPWTHKDKSESDQNNAHGHNHNGTSSSMALFDDDEFGVDDDANGADDTITSDLVWTWACLLVLSCLLLTFSAHLYKWAMSSRTISRRRYSLGLITANALLATMHLAWASLLSIPIAMITFLPSYQFDLRSHWMDSIRCLFLSSNTILDGNENELLHVDRCTNASLWVHGAILASILHAAALWLMVRYGSLKLLSSAVMITIVAAYVVFSVLQATTESLPSSSDPWLDLVGLVCILFGVGFYRFGSASMTRSNEENAHLAHGVLHSSIYFVEVGGAGGEESNDGDTTSFMEFLREPFLLQGDV